MHVLIGSTNGYLCVNVLNKYYDQSVRVQSFDLPTEKKNQTDVHDLQIRILKLPFFRAVKNFRTLGSSFVRLAIELVNRQFVSKHT